MNLGLLDLPTPLLAAVDAGMGWIGIPGLLRVLAWGALGGAIGMWVYRRYSPQQRITEVRAQLRAVQQELAAYDGEFSGLRRLIKQQFGLVFTQLRLTALSALLAGVPVLLILPWLSNSYDARSPNAGDSIAVCATPSELAANLVWEGGVAVPAERAGCWQLQWPAAGAPVRLLESGQQLLELPMPVAARIVHRRGMLNALIGNPAGYLPESAKTHAVTFEMPSVELVSVGPPWLRGWTAAFFSAALLISLWLRSRWRLH